MLNKQDKMFHILTAIAYHPDNFFFFFFFQSSAVFSLYVDRLNLSFLFVTPGHSLLFFFLFFLFLSQMTDKVSIFLFFSFSFLVFHFFFSDD